MSAPPPIGPQPPPSPPPQGYPPPYPAPPAYYAPPAAPPPAKSNTALIVVLIVVVVVVLLAAVAWWAMTVMMAPVQQFTRVTVTGVYLTYTGSSSGDFSPSPVTSCAGCPMTMFVGTNFQYALTLTNIDMTAHTIGSIAVTTPFTLVSTSPTLPLVVSAGSGATIYLTIQASTIGGSYTLAGTITTS